MTENNNLLVKFSDPMFILDSLILNDDFDIIIIKPDGSLMTDLDADFYIPNK